MKRSNLNNAKFDEELFRSDEEFPTSSSSGSTSGSSASSSFSTVRRRPTNCPESDDWSVPNSIIAFRLGQILDALNLNVSNPTDTNLLGNALYKASHPLETQIDFATLYDQPRIDQQAISTLKFSTTPRSVLSSNGANFGFEAMSSVDKNILRNALLTSPQALAMSGLLSLELLDNSMAWDHWMCTLASSLTPVQWQLFWKAYVNFFGLQSLPTHLLSFFSDFNVRTKSNQKEATNIQQQQESATTEGSQIDEHHHMNRSSFWQAIFRGFFLPIINL